MADVSTVITRILRGPLQDPDQTNYGNDELNGYFNEALDYLSRELGKFKHKIAQRNMTLIYTAGVYAADLPTNFLELDHNDLGKPRVFNVTNDDAQMRQAFEYEVDGYEYETVSDDGTPSIFYFRGNQLLIHPRPYVETQVKIYYFKIEAITDGDSTIPWNGIFDRAIEQFVILKCRARSEQFNFIQLDDRAWEVLRMAAHDVCFRRGRFQINPTQGMGNTGSVPRGRCYNNGTHYG